MMHCALCGELIKDGDEIMAGVRGYYSRQSEVTHGLEVTEELWLEHWNCLKPNEN